MKLFKYKVNITYVPGKEMHIADALSHVENGIVFMKDRVFIPAHMRTETLVT